MHVPKILLARIYAFTGRKILLHINVHIYIYIYIYIVFKVLLVMKIDRFLVKKYLFHRYIVVQS